MKKKIVTWAVCVFFLSAFAHAAWADQSIGFRAYFRKGIQAYQDHDAQEALRCFRIAAIYDPSDENLQRYLEILRRQGVVLRLPASLVPPQESIGYKYYLSGAIAAYQQQNYRKALRYFEIAQIFYPGSQEARHYSKLLGQPQAVAENVPQLPSFVPEQLPSYYWPTLEIPPEEKYISPEQNPNAPSHFLPLIEPRPPAPVVVLPQENLPIAQEQIPAPSTEAPPIGLPSKVSMPAENVGPVNVPSQMVSANVPSQAQGIPNPQPSYVGNASAVSVPQAQATYVAAAGPRRPIQVLMLEQITNNSQLKAAIQLEIHSSVIIQGRNIQRYLIVDQGVLAARIINPDHLEIDTLRIGTTFVHIWDDYGRHTLYVQVVFPQTANGGVLAMSTIGHSKPFIVTYSNDWNTYYQGKNVSQIKRQSYDFNQNLGITGETPYGFFDASGSYEDFNAFSSFDTYTVGLSQIPLPGTSNFDLRGFDAVRYMSPLTMPGTNLRGVFADVDVLDNTLGIFASEGQEEVPPGFYSSAQLQSPYSNAYIDAAKITLFPLSQTDRYSINFATAYGPQRQTDLTNHVYSVEGMHKFNQFLSLNGEAATDTNHDSQIASLKWREGTFMSNFNFRNIDKNYSTISTLPAYQGETGPSWSTEGDFKKLSESTFVEAYQDHLDSNPNHPNAFNFDGNGHLKYDLTPNVWSDSNLNFVDDPGELSPQKNFDVDQRLSRSFGLWRSLRGSVFGGAGYQTNSTTGAPEANYNKEDVIAGIQLPLTDHVSTYTNFEYDWLNQPDSGGRSNPKVINAGIEYEKQFNTKFSVTSQAIYRDELGVNGTESLLSGERSIILSTSLNYNPVPDVSLFADGDVNRVISHIGNLPYDDFEVHVGMRLTFGGATYWDPMGTVSGIVFKDRNDNGKFGDGDEGMPGIKLKVGDKEVVTDKHGRFSIKVRAKTVEVVPVMDSVPGGYLFSTPQVLNVTIVQGHVTHADFGLTSQTGIYGIIFVDENHSGVPNDTDKFIGKVRVILDGKTIQKSDSHGTFYFRKVSPGVHTLSIDLNTMALNMVPTIKLKNEIDVAEGTNYMFNIPVQIKQAISQQQ